MADLGIDPFAFVSTLSYVSILIVVAVVEMFDRVEQLIARLMAFLDFLRRHRRPVPIPVRVRRTGRRGADARRHRYGAR